MNVNNFPWRNELSSPNLGSTDVIKDHFQGGYFLGIFLY